MVLPDDRPGVDGDDSCKCQEHVWGCAEDWTNALAFGLCFSPYWSDPFKYDTMKERLQELDMMLGRFRGDF